MCFAYLIFRGKERYLGFVDPFANLGFSLALHFFGGEGGGGGTEMCYFFV